MDDLKTTEQSIDYSENATPPTGSVSTPHISVHHVTLFVRDHDRSIRFLTEKLGFKLLFDQPTDNVGRFVAVAPPDGSTFFGLIVPPPESPQHSLIGRSGNVVLVTDDIQATYEKWRSRGVVFKHPPQATEWRGAFTSFTDPDGNSFALMSQDDVSRDLAARRRAAAEREEAERRAAFEMEIARQVQARLFPQVPPRSRAIDFAGRCLQARVIGGDYFDFLPLENDRTGFVVGDISGKGIGAALLMANLQAHVRSQSAIALQDPERFLESVNRQFFESTDPYAYATLFFADYCETTSTLRYVNCGHPGALVLRANGKLEELQATNTVLGLFSEWKCAAAETTLSPGDMFVLYTDGLTEWLDATGTEFGIDRLISALRRSKCADTSALLDEIFSAVRAFGAPEQMDDVTLIIAKCLAH